MVLVLVTNFIGNKANIGFTSTPAKGSLVVALYILPVVVKVDITGVLSSISFLTSLALSNNNFA